MIKLINNALEYVHDNIMVVLTVLMAFTAGVLAAEAAHEEPQDVYINAETVTIRYDYSRLTRDTCTTEQECSIAEAIEFHDGFRPPETIPILEPVDCGGLKGKEYMACMQANKTNAGKPMVYPTVCEPYIFKGA